MSLGRRTDAMEAATAAAVEASQVEALRRERDGYVRAGRLERAGQVTAELVRRGVEPVQEPVRRPVRERAVVRRRSGR
jgi:pentatricopeptide repeat protein